MAEPTGLRVAKAAAYAIGAAAAVQVLMLGSPMVAGTVALMLVSAAALLRARDRLPASGDVSRTTARVLLAVVVVAGLVLRVYDLTDRPAWDDEMWTLRNIYTADWGTLFRVAFDDYWPPLHYIVLSALTRVTSTDIFWLRLPSVVFGAATIPATYWLAREVFGSRWAGLLAAGLLAGMTYHVLYSQEARVYALLVLLATLSAVRFYRAFWDRRVSVAFIAVTVLLTYAHSFAAWYFVAAQWGYVLLLAVWTRDRGLIRPAVISQLVVLACWLPLLAAFAISRFARDVVVPTHWAEGIEDTPLLSDFVELYQTLSVRSWAGAALIALGGALALYSASRAWKAAGIRESRPGPLPPRTHHATLFLLSCAVVPVLISLIGSTVTPLHTFPLTRYHIAILPALCALVAGGLAALRGRGARTTLLCTLVLLPTAELPRYYRDFTRAAYDEAARFVASRSAPDEPIFVGSGFRVFAYYFRGAFPRIGSEQWDSLVAEYGGDPERYSMEGRRYGDTYAHEKLPEQIEYFGYYRFYREEPHLSYLRERRDAGRLEYPFWLVFHDAEAGILDQLESVGRPCGAGIVEELRGVTVRRCTGVGS